MVVAALLRAEPLTARKTSGVLIATAGVALALATGLGSAPAGAWRGDLLMVGAALCMALYNVWSKPFIQRSGPIPFTVMGMSVGAACLIAALVTGNLWYVLAGLIAGYLLACIGHVFFEKNRPATFTYPVYSFMGDWVMWRDILGRRIKF